MLWDTILAKLNDRELLVVVGHEMGHYVLNHIVKGMVFAFFLIHVFSGGAYETRTVAAMTFRSTVWVVAAITAWMLILPPKRRVGG